MIGYVFVLLALLCSVGKGYFGKICSNNVITIKDAMMLNFTRMVICTILGIIISVITYKGFGFFAIPSKVFLITLVSGVSITMFVINWVFAVQKGAFSLVDVFITIGVVIPIIMTHFIYHEEIKISQWIGMALLIVASIIMCKYSSGMNKKVTPFEMMLLVAIAISNGIFLFAQKWFVYENTDINSSVYNLYTYLIAAVIFGIAFVITIAVYKVKKIPETRNNSWMIKTLPFLLCLSVCFFMYSYLLTFAAAHLNSVILYPLVQGISLALSGIMAAVAFKEKITIRSIIGIGITIASILIINLL